MAVHCWAAAGTAVGAAQLHCADLIESNDTAGQCGVSGNREQQRREFNALRTGQEGEIILYILLAERERERGGQAIYNKH